MEDNVSMEVKELHGVTLSAISAPYAVSWSEDNKISLITSTTLHIIELCPSPSFTSSGFSIKRTLIKPDDDMPTTKSGINTDDLMWKLEQPEVYEMILDTSLSPKLNGTKALDIHLIQAHWSDAGMLQDNRCMLACVSSSGSVKLRCPRKRNWPVVADISELWQKHCSKEWTEGPSSDPHEIFKILKKRTSELQITVVQWAELQTNPSKFSFFVTGHLDGLLIVWRVGAVQLARRDEAVVNLVLKQETGLRRITALHWLCWDEHSVSLVVGDVEGRVKLVSLKVMGETVTCEGLVDVWIDADRMRVMKITSLRPTTDSEIRTLAVVKDTYVVLFLIRRDKVLATHPHLLGSLAVAGLEEIDSETFLVCTHSGCMTKLHVVQKESKELSVEAEDLPCDISFKRLACYGIASAKQFGLWVMATSICKLYDHLVIRKPAQALFFHLQSGVEPMTVIVNNPTKRLTNYWPYLEMIRFQCVKKRSPPELRCLECPDELDMLSTYELKVELWLARVAFALLPSPCGAQRQQELVSYVSQLEYLLFCRHACSRIRAQSTIARPLLEFELASLGLLRTWVQVWHSSALDISPGSNATAELARSTLALPQVPNIPERELCYLCNEEVLMTPNWRHALCPNNHRLARCCRTLLTCQSLPYRLCQVCPAMAVEQLGPDDEVLCVFCDSPLILDDKIRIPLDETTKQELKEAEEQKKKKKKEEEEAIKRLNMIVAECEKNSEEEMESENNTEDEIHKEKEIANETDRELMEHTIEMVEVQHNASV